MTTTRAKRAMSMPSGDLYGSTLNYINSDKDFNPENFAGRNIRFGIREHAMCSIMNGIAYDGIFRPSGAREWPKAPASR